MHDPMTVAFEIRYLWRAYGDNVPSEFLRTYHNPFITIWHVDPEKDGSDDSCDWSGRRRRMNTREKALTSAIDNLLHTLGNRPFYPDLRLYGPDYHQHELTSTPPSIGLVGELEQAWYGWRRHSGFRIHPRWHIWHWKFQIHPLQDFKRWAFTRCADCGGRFAFGQSGWTNQWNGGGPRWFRSEPDLHHMDCGQHARTPAAA